LFEARRLMMADEFKHALVQDAANGSLVRSRRQQLHGQIAKVLEERGLMPSLDAIQQAVREPLLRAPYDHKGFAIYIFERAREIDHEWALAKNLVERSKRIAAAGDP
jgi:hypothetical protein